MIQDGYMNALTGRVRREMSDQDVLILSRSCCRWSSVLVLAAALILSNDNSEGLATLSSALQGVESEHLLPLELAVKAINAQFEIILGALPGLPAAAIVAERRPR